MKKLFNQLPLPAKLMLIGIVPMAFFMYLSAQLYNERSQKVNLFGSYLDRMHRSADLSMLINNLQTERKYSFDYSLNKTMQQELVKQRPLTDSSINRMSHYDETLKDFASYTFLDQLSQVRTGIDSSHMAPGIVMDYYSSTIYRINTLNTLPTGSFVYLKPVYKDLVAQKLLSEMITFLGIMSANVYNALYSRQYMIEILVGTAGTYRVYKTLQTEFLLKASPAAILAYKEINAKNPLAQTNAYIDTLFKKFAFDSLYTHAEWDNISTAGIDELRHLQQKLLQQVQTQVADTYDNEKTAKTRTLIFLLFSLFFVSLIVFYTIHTINQTLNALKEAAHRISLGASDQSFSVSSNDVIGKLAHSISTIDKNNKQLANAAHAIGKGHFDVPVEPRSTDDILGNAIVDMKTNLQRSTTELTASNTELERFAYVASHDLQEPLRMVSSFLHLLEKKMDGKLDDDTKQYIDYAMDGAERMKGLIQDLLQYSRVGTSKEKIAAVDCNEVMEAVQSVLALSIHETKGRLDIHPLPVINGVQAQILQLFQNLIGNALKYHSDEPPVVEIGCVEKENMWEFYVKDNGIGIDSKFFDKIFIIFQRLHSKTDYSGTGIGLSICKKIVEKHGGRIWVVSEPGKGSIFYFTISKNKP